MADHATATSMTSVVVDKKDHQEVYSCFDRLRWELRPSYPFFSLQEPCGWIHAGRSFAPRCSAFLRGLFLLWSLQVFFYDIYHYPPHNYYIYMGYLTHWGHALTILYFFISFLFAVLPFQQPPPPLHSPHCLLKLLWGLYDTVAPMEVAITLLYWASGFNYGIPYIAVMEHGGLCVLLLLDGRSIPVRAKHAVFLLLVSLLYLLWTIIDAILDIGSGEWGPAYNDDALYPVLNWKKETKGAAIVSAVVICVLAPLLYMVIWIWSLRFAWDGSRRPLYQEDTYHEEKMFDYKGLDNADMA